MRSIRVMHDILNFVYYSFRLLFMSELEFNFTLFLKQIYFHPACIFLRAERIIFDHYFMWRWLYLQSSLYIISIQRDVSALRYIGVNPFHSAARD